MKQHIKRANYQTLIWKKALVPFADLPDPVGNGWNLTDGILQPTLMTKEPAPKSLLELVSCGCKLSKCSRRDCQCKANNLACIESCTCLSNEECKNPYNKIMNDFDDNDE